MRYEVKLKRITTDAKGNDKEVKEAYLVENAESFGDAELQAQQYWNGECDVVAVSLSKVMEVVNYPTQEEKEALHVFKAVIVSTFVDENSGEERETRYPVLLWADSVEKAMVMVKEYLRAGLDDLTCVGITKTKIVDII